MEFAYPRLDLSASRRAALDFQRQYNLEVRRHNQERQQQGHRDGMRLLLRDNVVQTYIEILECVAGHLLRNREYRLSPARAFVVCHTMLANRLDCDRGTIMRRIRRMKESGLLAAVAPKPAACLDHGVQVSFQPGMLISDKEEQLSWQRPALPLALFSDPLLQNATQQTCELNKNHNQNQQEGSCGLAGGAATAQKERSESAAATTAKCEAWEPDKNRPQDGQRAETSPASHSPEAGASEPEHRGAAAGGKTVNAALRIALRSLWPHRKPIGEERSQLLEAVSIWFGQRIRAGGREDRLLAEFEARIALVAEYVSRSPARFVPQNIAWYFNLGNPNGFARSAAWYNQHRRDKARNAALYRARTAIIEAVAAYLTQPGLSSWHQLRDTLHKQHGQAAADLLTYGIGLAANKPPEEVLRATEARTLAWIQSHYTQRPAGAASEIRQLASEARAEHAYSIDPRN